MEDNNFIKPNELSTFYNKIDDDINNELNKKINCNCTNSKELNFNIKNTQEIFYCLDCKIEEKYNAICIACSIHCHNNHKLVEIGNRRNIRCDCYNISNCKYSENIEKNNDFKNIYNKNFENLFCDCKKEYDNNRYMIQCFSCEDYKHLDCMNINIEIREYIYENDISDNLLNFLCINCFKNKFNFLLKYDNLIINSLEKLTKLIENEDIKNNEDVQKDKICLVDDLIISNKNQENKGYLLDGYWFKNICFCDKCVEFYELSKINNIIEILNEEISDEYLSKFFKNDNKDEMIKKFYDNLKNNYQNSLEKIDMSKKYKFFSNVNDFIKNFVNYINNIADDKENNVINEDHINNFFKNQN